MAILSYEFALCFVLFFIIYWSFYRSVKIQNWLLLLAGIGFLLSWQWLFLVSIVFVWLVLQACTYGFMLAKKHWQKQLVLLLGLIALVAHLCFFKYSNFAIEQLNQTLLTGHNLTPLDIIMPLGISFYTFQAISYLVDVYQEKMQPMPSGILLGFLAFVPTLTAGPIFRAKDAQTQWQLPVPLASPETSLADRFIHLKTASFQIASDDQRQQNDFINWQKRAGFRVGDNQPIVKIPPLPRRYIIEPYIALALIVIALFKKLVLAGWLETLWVNPVFANPMQFHGLEVLTAIYAYSLKLFFDFSGYTDLVIAIALLLGFRLPENFNRPYLATDIQDFWKKWHITLSTWIRDYLYIPLGGGRCSFWRVQLNLMLAFIISGVWHGAGWNFFIWGAIHGVALVWLNILKRFNMRFWLTKYAKPLAIFITFHYVAFGWVFFRSVSTDQALQVLQALGNVYHTTFSLSVLPTLLIMVLAWLIYPFLGHIREQLAKALSYIPWWLLPIVISLYVVLVFNLAPEGLPGFIYANF